MAVDIAGAINAYKQMARGEQPDGLDARPGAEGADFASVLRRAGEDAIEVLRQGESETLKAAAGKADITDVVTAVGQAEITLQTVVAVRDRVIQAYQEILRMPV